MSARDRHELGRFSRERLEFSSDPNRLCADLAAMLTSRLASATDRLREAHAIVDDLRATGHMLWSWDESFDFSIWGDDYVNPPFPTRFLVEMRWPSKEDPLQPLEVVVTFGSWPRAKT